jgi:NADH-quinone oxidoreductase subunit L
VLHEKLPWIILLLPLVAAVAITLFTQRDGRFSAQLSIGAVALAFIASVMLLAISLPQLADSARLSYLRVNWLEVTGLKITLAWRVDRLSLLMLLIVTGVGGLIHLYSYGYMAEDRARSRYFAGLSFFTFSMLGIVLADNFVVMFMFWELVGLSSYLLIGHWYAKESAADACKKAFLTNRLGDFGFILGILLIWGITNHLDFDAVRSHLTGVGAMASLAGFLIFCGAMGKSAQFPLHVWLPDAMEGPTPISALIHAATMVAAGVYMLCRVFFLFEVPQAWPEWLSFLHGWTALDLVALSGGITALLAALIAVQQDDIKRILAYSTLSQLGYMVMAVGLAGPGAAMYHLTTHAFFKALLFLGAGSVIYALHHEQDIWRMGGLRQKMPVTFWTFLLATLALCGVPPFSGFFSKDEILALASQRHVGYFVLATLVAALTTFYMFRLFFVAFLGKPRSESAGHAHESPKVMTVPLMLLAIPSVFAGYFGINTFLERHFHPGEAIPHLSIAEEMFAPFAHAPIAALLGLAAVAFGFSAAYALYTNAEKDPLPEKLGVLSRAMRNRFYFDEIYSGLIRITHELLAQLADWFDRWIVAGLMVRGLHGTTELVGRGLRLVQTGNLQTYAFIVAAGVALVLYIFLR